MAEPMDVPQLTEKIMEVCRGQNIAVVLNASLGVMTKALEKVPTPEQRHAVANDLRLVAKTIDQAANGGCG
jgi:hypothetical protein